jgi:hypothetical protein
MKKWNGSRTKQGRRSKPEAGRFSVESREPTAKAAANQPYGDHAWDAWRMLVDQLLNESKKKSRRNNPPL